MRRRLSKRTVAQPDSAKRALVVGVEGDIQGLAGNSFNSASATDVPLTAGGFVPGFDALQTINVTQSLDDLATIRGRIGYLFTPTLLVYGTGGVAFGGVNSSTSISGAPIASPTTYSSLAAAALSGAGFTNSTQISTHFYGNIVRAGVNSHFNWGAPAPVVAKY